ncbi:hypothetical protein [Modicisalibacter xianhensis]|uniref:hypothetical protein n=1 Tax=Modicisalibacter xianhensis TaxID=442341 RepID=UPI0010628204|nr:hypothetical protein [Halomonas xianhensis]
MRPRPIMERHLQTLLLTLVAGLIAWSGMTTMRLVETQARQDERVTHLITLTESLRNEIRGMEDRYMSRSDAEIYRAQFSARMDGLDQRISVLEDAN